MNASPSKPVLRQHAEQEFARELAAIAEATVARD